MAIKDKIVKWFIENILIPQQEIIDKPGFIVTQFSDKGKQVFLREIFMPESVISKLEQRIISKFGKRGKTVLYSAGKMFGHSYAERSYFPKITSSSTKEFDNFVYVWIRYAEATSYGEITYDFNKNSLIIRLQLTDFMVCPHNGIGYFTTSGSFAGFWSYLLDDYSVEAIQTKCRGKGDPICEVVAGPKKVLDKVATGMISSKTKYGVLTNDMASNINAIRPCRFNNNSFKALLDSHFFNYEKGIVIKENERHFLIESYAMYFLERELKKIDKSNKILFDLSFEFGKSLSRIKEKNYETFISTYLSALGYGDISVSLKKDKFHVSVDYFPWSPSVGEINFAYFRGVISGLLSGFNGRNIFLKKINYDVLQGFLRLDISE